MFLDRVLIGHGLFPGAIGLPPACEAGMLQAQGFVFADVLNILADDFHLSARRFLVRLAEGISRDQQARRGLWARRAPA